MRPARLASIWGNAQRSFIRKLKKENGITSGRQWRKYRKQHGILTAKKSRRATHYYSVISHFRATSKKGAKK